MRTPRQPSYQVVTGLCAGCDKGCRAMEAGRRITRTTRGARSGGARWGPSSWEGSWGNHQTPVPAHRSARRAVSLPHGEGASVPQPASAWWSLTSPTLQVTAATWQPITAQVRMTSRDAMLSLPEKYNMMSQPSIFLFFIVNKHKFRFSSCGAILQATN